MQGTRGASLSDDAETTDTPGRRRIGVLGVVAAVVIVLDQVTKIIAIDRLDDGRVVPVIDGFLQLRLVRNPGAAFGLAGDFTVVLALIVIGVIVAILRMSRQLTSAPWAVALGGMLGGAFGNLIDRLVREPGPLRGRVIDFIEIPNWPVFNIADSAVVGGAVLVALLSLRGIRHDGHAGDAGSPDAAADTAGDASRVDAALPPGGTAVPPGDTGALPGEAGISPDDTEVSGDAGLSPGEAGVAPGDTGVSDDTGVSPGETGASTGDTEVGGAGSGGRE
jgi:signal peptidase II